LITIEAGLTEKKMFGGLAFLVDGNMSVSTRAISPPRPLT
jgi:hypothetical protein